MAQPAPMFSCPTDEPGEPPYPGLCEKQAAYRLLQAQHWGIQRCDVSPLFSRPVNDTPVQEEDWRRGKRLLYSTRSALAGDPKLTRMGWTPILFRWEPYYAFAEDAIELGNFVYTDSTLTRFLIINLYGAEACSCCGVKETKVFGAASLLCARRLLGLLTYLPMRNPVRWVRASYATKEHPVPFSRLFDFSDNLPVSTPLSEAGPSVFHLPASSVSPIFTAPDLQALNYIMWRCGFLAPSNKVRQAVLAEGEAVESVRLSLTEVHSQEVGSGCGYCDKAESVIYLQKCSACRNSFFCDRDCQRKGWKEHKQVCMPRGA
ncbi:hypothetical protein JCM6882_009337 [Rhodosporidiobolus microsporus]